MTNSKASGGKLSKILSELKLEYKNSFPDKVERIRQLCGQQDWTALTCEFHKLKGTGRTYGFPEVSLLCEALEAYCLAGNVDSAEIEKVFPVFQRMQLAWKEGLFFNPQQDPEAASLMKLNPARNGDSK